MRPKNYLSKMVWYFIGVYIINRTIHGRLEIRNFSSRVEKNISRVSAVNEWNIFQHEKRNFPSPRGHIISSIYKPCWNNGKSVSLLLLLLLFFLISIIITKRMLIFSFFREDPSPSSHIIQRWKTRRRIPFWGKWNATVIDKNE